MKSRRCLLRLDMGVLTLVGMRQSVELLATVASTYWRPGICIRVFNQVQISVSGSRRTAIPRREANLFIPQESLLIAPLVLDHAMQPAQPHLAISMAQYPSNRGPYQADKIFFQRRIQPAEAQEQTKLRIRRDLRD